MEELIDDAWAYAFAMSLGTKQPSEKLKARFIVFAKERLPLTASQDDVINLIRSIHLYYLFSN